MIAAAHRTNSRSSTARTLGVLFGVNAFSGWRFNLLPMTSVHTTPFSPRMGNQGWRQIGVRLGLRDFLALNDLQFRALFRGSPIKRIKRRGFLRNCLRGAREALELALSQDQLLGGIGDPNGVQVMTIHKAKGKQFDGVIVVREGRHNGKTLVSSFVWRNDSPPYHRSRKILHVAVTRAKAHTLILDPAFPRCPILGSHHL